MRSIAFLSRRSHVTFDSFQTKPKAHHAERNIEALARMGEESPLVAELMNERDQLKDKLAGLQEEQSELMADLTKAVGKVDVQEEVINTVGDVKMRRRRLSILPARFQGTCQQWQPSSPVLVEENHLFC